MKSIIDHFRKILDFPEGNGWDGLIIEETKSKFNHTFMELNSEIKYIKRITLDGVLYRLEGDGDNDDSEDDSGYGFIGVESIDTLSPVLPETGVYHFKKGGSPIFLEKFPRRQWKKSFSWSFYKYKFIGNVDWNDEMNVSNLDSINLTSRSTITVDKFDGIYFENKKIGYKKDGDIYCIAPLFKQELIDWMKYGRH